MINNWKLGFKSLRYAYGRKANFILMGTFFAIGLIFIMGGASRNSVYAGGYMLTATAMLPTQMIYSLSASNMVQSSPVKKKMQTAVPAFFTCGNFIVMYVLNVLIHGIIAWGQPEAVQTMKMEVLLCALGMVIMMIYLAVAYKYFVVSTVIFIFLYFSMFNGINSLFNWDMVKLNSHAYLQISALGLLLVVLGGFLQYLLSLLVYKAPISKMAQSATLRREL